MLNDEEKSKLKTRLRRVAGQVAAVERMVDEDADCVDVLMQIAAVNGALGRVGQIILESHVKSCVAEAMKNGSVKDRDAKLEELIEIFRKYAQLVD